MMRAKEFTCDDDYYSTPHITSQPTRMAFSGQRMVCMYEISVMLAVFFIVTISCWWIGDGNERLPAAHHSVKRVPQTTHLQMQEGAGLGD